jgi:hypothetical protein
MTEPTAPPEAATPPVDSTDAAWVTVPAPQPPAELAALCRDVEAIFRVNPYLYFQVWRKTAPDRYHAEFRNDSNKQELTLDLTARSGPDLGMTVEYAQGIKRRTVFTIQPSADGSCLTITDDYERLSPAEREQRASEVDKSLRAWGESLRIYFLRFRRYGWVPGWRWYMRRLWIPMKPSARRIVWLLYLITLVEFCFFLFVLTIYVLEQNR